jgi:hypothetical protein
MNTSKMTSNVNASSEIHLLMEHGKYENAAECVLQYAEKLAVQAENSSGKEKSDEIASSYRGLVFLAANQELKILHQQQSSQIAERMEIIAKVNDLEVTVKNNVKEFITHYKSLTELFVQNPTPANLFNRELNRLDSFGNGKTEISKEQFLNDIIKLLERVEPTDSKPNFWVQRYQIKGTRYKCERGYADALSLVAKIKESLLQYEKLKYNDVISYQEIYWRCGTKITWLVNDIIGKISGTPSRWG